MKNIADDSAEKDTIQTELKKIINKNSNILRSVFKNLEKDTVSTIKKNSIIINLKKNVKLSILCSFKLSDFKDDDMTTVSIKQFIKKKTSKSSSKSSSNYSFSSIFINNIKTVYKLCTCLFKIVLLTIILNNL